MNKVILMGRLVKDIEPRYSNNGNIWLTNTLAVDRKFEKDQTDFINIKAFGKTAEIMEKYLKKGSKIAICGEIRVNTYEDNGTRKISQEIVVNEVDFAGSVSKKEQQAKEYEEIEAEFVNLDDLESADVPF